MGDDSCRHSGLIALVTNVTDGSCTASPNAFPILAIYGRIERNVSELLKPWQKRFELIITFQRLPKGLQGQGCVNADGVLTAEVSSSVSPRGIATPRGAGVPRAPVSGAAHAASPSQSLTKTFGPTKITVLGKHPCPQA